MIVFRVVAESIAVSHCCRCTPIHGGTKPNRKGLDKRVGTLGLIEAVIPSVVIPPNLRKIHGMGGVEVNRSFGLTFVA
jgi:hypothetical protein